MNVQEPIEFTAHLLQRADMYEPGAFVEMQACFAALGDVGDQRVKSQPPRLIDHRLFERSSDASPPKG